MPALKKNSIVLRS